MIYVNANVDAHSFTKVDTGELNRLLHQEWEDPLNITFIARKGHFEEKAYVENGENFLWVILPYEELLASEDATTFILNHLADNLCRLDWLGHEALKERIEKLLNKRATRFSAKGFLLLTAAGTPVKFEYYLDAAPLSCEAFDQQLPFTRMFLHASVSGQEIWISNGPLLDIIQENASVFPKPGEAIVGPVRPLRNRISGCMGIYYGEGKGLDAGNIFARVVAEDRDKLAALGDSIWKEGAQELRLESWPAAS